MTKKTQNKNMLMLLIVATLFAITSVDAVLNCTSTDPCEIPFTGGHPPGFPAPLENLQCGETFYYEFELPRNHNCQATVIFDVTDGANTSNKITFGGDDLLQNCQRVITSADSQQCENVNINVPMGIDELFTVTASRPVEGTECNSSVEIDYTLAYYATCATTKDGWGKNGSFVNTTGGEFYFETLIGEGGNFSGLSIFDVNSDNVINDTDYYDILSRDGERDGTFWTPLIDFNAQFGVYEVLLDYTLGFRAYLGKIVNGAMPIRWFITQENDGRCSYDEDNTSTDCHYCNNDGFCAINEYEYLGESCQDCNGTFPLEPQMTEFDSCSETTDMADVLDIEHAENFTIEGEEPGCNDGNIMFTQEINLTNSGSGYIPLDINTSIDIIDNYISVNTIEAPQLEKEAQLTIYNRTWCHPGILKNGAECVDCPVQEYGDKIKSLNATGIADADLLTNVTGQSFTLELQAENYTFGKLTQNNVYTQQQVGQDSPISVEIVSGALTTNARINITGINKIIYLPKMNLGGGPSKVYVAEDGSTYTGAALTTISKSAADPIKVTSLSAVNTSGPHGKSFFWFYAGETPTLFATINNDGIFNATGTTTVPTQVKIVYTAEYPVNITLDGHHLFLPSTFPISNAAYPATNNITYKERDLVNVKRTPEKDLSIVDKDPTNLTFTVPAFGSELITVYESEDLVPSYSNFNGSTTNFCYAKDETTTRELSIFRAVIEDTSNAKLGLVSYANFTKLDLNNEIIMGGSNKTKIIWINGSTSDEFEGKAAIITFHRMDIVHPQIMGTVTNVVPIRHYVPPGETLSEFIFYAELTGSSPINITIVDADNPTEFLSDIDNITIRNGTQEVRINVSDHFSDDDVNVTDLEYGVANQTGSIKVTFEKAANVVTAIIRPLTRFFNPFSFQFFVYEPGVIDGESAFSNFLFGNILPDRPPIQTQTILDIVFNEDENGTIDLSDYFEDPDNHPLHYTWTPIDAGGNITIHKQGMAQSLWWNITNATYTGNNSMTFLQEVIALVQTNTTELLASPGTYGYIVAAGYADQTAEEGTDLLRINFWNTTGNGMSFPEGNISITYDNGKDLKIYIPEVTYTDRNNFSLFVSKDGSTYYDEGLTQIAKVSPNPIVVPSLVIEPDSDWHGKRTIVFIANDTIHKKTSNNVDIIVHNLNDAPRKHKDIDDIVMLEGTVEFVVNVTPDYLFDIDIPTDTEFEADDELTLTYSKQGGGDAEFINLTFSNNGVYSVTEDKPVNITVKALDFPYWNGYEALTVKATDSYGKSVETNFTVYIIEVPTDLNRTILPAYIPMVEDETYPFELNNNWFVDVEGDATYRYFGLNSTNITIELNIDSGNGTIRADPDWFGVAVVNFSASDATSNVSDMFVINVTPVNDAPRLYGDIEVKPWPKDESYLVNLSDHFYEAYGEDTNSLVFSDIDIIPTLSTTYHELIANSYTSETANMTPDTGWYGSGWITFCADDGQYQTCSNIVRLNITSDKPPQLISPFNSPEIWPEDNVNYINLEEHFWDEELGSELDFTPSLIGPFDGFNITPYGELINSNVLLNLSNVRKAAYNLTLGGGFTFIAADNSGRYLTTAYGTNGTQTPIFLLSPLQHNAKPIKIYKTSMKDPSFELPEETYNLTGNANISVSYTAYEGDKSRRVERNIGTGITGITTIDPIPVVSNQQYTVSAVITTENIRDPGESVTVAIECDGIATEVAIPGMTTQKQGLTDWEDWDTIQRVYNVGSSTECRPKLIMGSGTLGTFWADLFNFDKYYPTNTPEREMSITESSLESATGGVEVFLPELNNTLQAIYLGIDGTTYYDENMTVVARRSPNMALVPDEHWYGNRTMAIIATDGMFNRTSNNIKLRIEPVNDIPIFKGPIQNIPMNESESRAVILSNYFEDVEDKVDLDYTLITNTEPGNIFVTINKTENETNATITTAPGWVGFGELQFKATDSKGASNESNVFIVYVGEYSDKVFAIPGANTTYFLVEDQGPKQFPVKNKYFNDTDDDAVYWYTIDETKFNMTAWDEDAGFGFIKPLPDYCNFVSCTNTNGYDNITLHAQDPISGIVNTTVQMVVECVPDIPRIEDDIYITFPEDTNYYTLIEYGYDPDKIWGCDNVTVEYPSYANVRVNLSTFDGFNMSFQPEPNFNGIEIINVTLTDAYGLQNSTIVTINVTPIDDPTQLNWTPYGYTIPEDTNLTENVSDKIWDVDNVLTLNATYDPSVIASIIFEPTMTVVPLIQNFLQQMIVTPVMDWFGLTFFDVYATNESGDVVANVSLYLNVTPVNDAPVCDEQIADQVMCEDTLLDILINGNIIDVDNETLNYFAQNLTAGIDNVTFFNGWRDEETLSENIHSVTEFNDVLYAVGDDGYIARYYDKGNCTAEYGWEQVENTSTANDLRAVHGYNGMLFTAGDNGEVDVYNGTWNNVSKFTSLDLHALETYDNKLWVGGDEGEIWTYNGNNWTNMTNLFINSHVRHLKAFDEILYVGQSSGTHGEKIDYYNTSEWRNIVNEPLNGSIKAMEEYDGKLFVSDDNGSIAHLVEETWTYLTGTNVNDIESMTVFDGMLYTGGASGEIDRFDGTVWENVTGTTTGFTTEMIPYKHSKYNNNRDYLFTFSNGDVDSYTGGFTAVINSSDNWFGNANATIGATDGEMNGTCDPINIEVTPVEDNPTFVSMWPWINTVSILTESYDVDNLYSYLQNLTLDVYNATIENNGSLLCSGVNVENVSCEFPQPEDNMTHTVFGYLYDSNGNEADNNPLNASYEFNPPTVNTNADERFWFIGDNGTITIGTTDDTGLLNIQYCVADYYEDDCTINETVAASGTVNSLILSVECAPTDIMCRTKVKFTAQDIFGNYAEEGSGRVNMIYGSEIYNTTVNETRNGEKVVVLNGSVVNNSNIIRSLVRNVTYNEVTIIDSEDKNSVTSNAMIFVDPSILENNTYIGPNTLINAIIKHSTIEDSDVRDSEGCHMIINESTIINGAIINGTVTWNGTVYSAGELTIKDENTNCVFDQFEQIQTPPSGGGGGGGSCTPNWECTEWTECGYYSGIRTRTCIDTRNCNRDRPVERETCRGIPACSDGLWNNGEEGVDCGGKCTPCSGEEEITGRPIIERPVTPIEEQPDTIEPPVEEETKVPWWFLLLLLLFIVAVIGFIAADMRKRQTVIPTVKESVTPVAVAEKPKQGVLMVEVEELEKSIQSVLGSGFTVEDVKQALMRKGWDEQTVNFALKEAVIKKYKLHEPHGELEKLEKSISSVVGHGYTCQDIRKSLVKKGWPRDVVDEALHETVVRNEKLHEVHNDVEQLVNSIKAVRCHGYAKDAIKKKLLDKGWPLAKVNEAMKKVP